MGLIVDSSQASKFCHQWPPLASLRDRIMTTTVRDWQEIADRLKTALSDYYVHLPLKRSSMGIDPVRELEILADDVRLIPTEDEFFQRLIGIFRRLRDRHTSIRLPPPRANAVAFLPFTLESYFDPSGNRHLTVSKMLGEAEDPTFVPGVEITHWNGIPIRRYIEAFSWETEGANPFARIALALRSLTVRPLAYMLPPNEDWAAITFIGAKGVRTTVFPWRVYFAQTGSATEVATHLASGAAALLEGIDRSTAVINGTWHDLFSQKVQTDDVDVAVMGLQNIRATSVQTRSGTYGYVRIFNFEVQDLPAFMGSMEKVLAQLPKTGLILDVRTNPGGMIPSGEGLLELLSEQPTTLAPVCFRNTPATRRLGQLPPFLPWKRSLEMQIETGEVFSQAFPLSVSGTGPGGIYKGPIVLVIDGLCYSTTDFLSAGFQDNSLGTIVGVDPVTGAGGANVWSLTTIAHLDRFIGGTLEPLPAGVDVNLAVRRSLRVGNQWGVPVEGLGTFADHVYAPTQRDLLGHNEDLIEFCGKLLKEKA